MSHNRVDFWLAGIDKLEIFTKSDFAFYCALISRGAPLEEVR